jgi:sulfur-oxidizing protein SoxY
MNRRNFLKVAGVTASVVAVSPVMLKKEAEAKPKKKSFEEALKEITGGKPVKDSNKVKLIAPAIAENGAVVPVKVTVDYPMEEGNYVKGIHILAKENTDPRTISVYLTPANGEAFFSTRIRLAKTMNVVAVAELSNGTFWKAEKPVKVTIGGCG